MITAQYNNSKNTTEIMLSRQTALDKARQEVTESTYDPATQVPLCQSEHNAWLTYWQPFWDALANTEQVDAGRSHYALHMAIETCSTLLMRYGWRQEQAAHNADTWRTIDSERMAEEASEAIAEEADQYQPTEDDLFWLDYEPSDFALAMEALEDTYPRGI